MSLEHLLGANMGLKLSILKIEQGIHAEIQRRDQSSEGVDRCRRERIMGFLTSRGSEGATATELIRASGTLNRHEREWILGEFIAAGFVTREIKKSTSDVGGRPTVIYKSTGKAASGA